MRIKANRFDHIGLVRFVVPGSQALGMGKGEGNRKKFRLPIFERLVHHGFIFLGGIGAGGIDEGSAGPENRQRLSKELFLHPDKMPGHLGILTQNRRQPGPIRALG
jgi:hypothetical protein